MPERGGDIGDHALPRRSMCGSTCSHVRNMLFRLTSLTRSQLSSVVSTGRPISTISTLLWQHVVKVGEAKVKASSPVTLWNWYDVKV
jgi:hypothetical protein